MPRVTIVGGPDINVVRTGPKGRPPIVFLHALGLDLTWWGHQIEEFGHDHDVVALDLPGHGSSSAFEGSPTFDQMARSVGGVLEQIDAGAVHLVGISLGGMIAQTRAVARPQCVRSLSLVATSCTFPDTARQALGERARVTRAGGMAAIAPLSAERWFPPGFRAQRPDVIDRAIKLMLRQEPAYHASLWDMVAALHLEQQLGDVSCPTMVVAGGEDPSAPASAGQRIVDRIAASTLHVIEGCGHFPPFEAPDAFNELVRSFVEAS